MLTRFLQVLVFLRLMTYLIRGFGCSRTSCPETWSRVQLLRCSRSLGTNITQGGWVAVSLLATRGIDLLGALSPGSGILCLLISVGVRPWPLLKKDPSGTLFFLIRALLVDPGIVSHVPYLRHLPNPPSEYSIKTTIFHTQLNIPFVCACNFFFLSLLSFFVLPLWMLFFSRSFKVAVFSGYLSFFRFGYTSL